MPVPDLHLTLQKYLDIMTPILTTKQLQRTKRIVEDFGKSGCLGEYLQNKLKNWLKSKTTGYAAGLISGIVYYKAVLDVLGLPIDRCHQNEKGPPLCMEQYCRLFSSYRVPGVRKDCLISHSTKRTSESRHIIVVFMKKFIISEDGACWLNFEHSPSDGIVIVQLTQHLLRCMEEVSQRSLARITSICELPYPRRLQWKFLPDVVQKIEAAAVRLDRFINDLDCSILKFNHFGREFPKSQNMSPDSFTQLALQLTYYNVHSHFVSSYESASTRRFRLGRTDNIRTNSSPALKWVKAMVGQTTTTEEGKLTLLQKAMDLQTKYMTEAILGNRIDCHLLGLRELAAELGMPTPDMFTDEAYKISSHFSLSTSQVPTETTSFLCGYGPVVRDGYGVCYNLLPDKIVVCVSSFKSCPETYSDLFAFTIESSFLQMYEL